MKIVFPSKIGLEVVIPAGIILGVTGGLLSWSEPHWLGIIIVPFVGYFIYLMFTTYYTIKEEELHIKCGFYRLYIPIADIKKIQKTHSIINAPALSFNRIEIIYSHSKSVLISPKNKKEFIQTLLAKHEQITSLHP